MPADIPLPDLISAILQRTPVWAWALLAGITLLGLRQTRRHVTSTARLVLAPLSFGVFYVVVCRHAFVAARVGIAGCGG